MPLGTQVGLNLSRGDTVLDEVAAPPKMGTGIAPSFVPMSIVAKRLDG